VEELDERAHVRVAQDLRAELRRARELAKEPHAGDERRAGRRVEGGHHVLHRA
tara:strand:- start:67 stop:225 length:159 start_codon:yes stop_codon:yes gene_type:complete